MHDPAVQSKALAHVGLAAMFTLLFGILAVAGEYRHGTITDTYLSFPRRRQVVLAKLAVYGAVGGAAGLVSGAVAVAVTAAWWAAKGGTFTLSGAGTWPALGGGVAANVAFATIGVGLGALVRNLVAAVAAALAWIALVEGIAGQLSAPGWPAGCRSTPARRWTGRPSPRRPPGCCPSGGAGSCWPATRLPSPPSP